MIPEAQLEELIALDQVATPGPWACGLNGRLHNADNEIVLEGAGDGGYAHSHPDVELACAARNVLPDLIAENRWLSEQLELALAEGIHRVRNLETVLRICRDTREAQAKLIEQLQAELAQTAVSR